MKLGFIYDAAFDILTPLLRPLGDSESAVCYLAAEIAKLGHNVTLFTTNPNSINVFDVRCRTIKFEGAALTADRSLQEPDYDAVILVNSKPELIPTIKSTLTKKIPVYLWTEYDHLNPINQTLNNKEIMDAIDGLICVSDWQRAALARNFLISRDKLAVRFHAISPHFEELFLDGKEFISYKPHDPQLAYIADPLSGLDILLDTFADVTNNYSKTSLVVFDQANFNTLDQEKINKIFKSASNLKNFYHVGLVTGIQLANQLRYKTIFAFPNNTEVTCSIPIMNAMAAGLYVVTSNLGALPEYCTEHGKCILDKNLRSDTLDSFIGQVLAICQSQTNAASSFFDYCYKQSVDMNKKHTWRVRAREWIHLLANAS